MPWKKLLGFTHACSNMTGTLFLCSPKRRLIRCILVNQNMGDTSGSSSVSWKGAVDSLLLWSNGSFPLIATPLKFSLKPFIFNYSIVCQNSYRTALMLSLMKRQSYYITLQLLQKWLKLEYNCKQDFYFLWGKNFVKSTQHNCFHSWLLSNSFPSLVWRHKYAQTSCDLLIFTKVFQKWIPERCVCARVCARVVFLMASPS